MLDRLRDYPIATPLAGAVLAGTVAIAASFAGLAEPYPVVIGLSVVIPILNVTSPGERFDVDAYEADRGPGGMAFDAILSAAAAALSGSLAAALVARAGLGGLVLVAVASIVTILGGIVTFLFRNSAYYRRE